MSLAGSIARYFTQDATVVRKGLRETDMGQFAELPADQATIKGRLQPLSGNEQLSADRLTVVRTHRFFTAFGADVLASDQLRIAGTLYAVTNNPKDPMSMGQFLEIDLLEGGHA